MTEVVELLICDLDNTLYDWVTYFSRSFSAMVDAAIPVLEVGKDQLLDDLRFVHQAHHNIEHPTAIFETRAARRRFPGADFATLQEHLKPAIDAFRAERSRSLVLYPGVEETLRQARAGGVRIVGHTEATVMNAASRLGELGIIGFFDQLYALEHRESPGFAETHIRANRFRVNSRIVTLHERKPNTRIVHEICSISRVIHERTLYVGDSISRDMSMANAAGVHSAWAQYGTRFSPIAWQSLVRVTHWTPEDVRRAQMVENLYGTVRPQVILRDSMTELLVHFDLGNPA